MSNWEDTVMSENEICDVLFGIPVSKTDVDIIHRREAIRKVTEAQAEISFKMGQNQATQKYREMIVRLIVPATKREARQAGIREVVEWIPQLIQAIKDEMWNDDWGVKGVLYVDMLDELVNKLMKEWGIK